MSGNWLTWYGFFPHNARLTFGGVPERPKGSDCKSDGSAFGGSNPPPSTRMNSEGGRTGRMRGCSSMVEPQPSKLMMWVRFPSPAPFIKEAEERVKRKEQREKQPPTFHFPLFSGSDAHIAQSVEHFLGKEEVIGSIPIMGSRICSTCDLSLANTTTDNKTR